MFEQCMSSLNIWKLLQNSHGFEQKYVNLLQICVIQSFEKLMNFRENYPYYRKRNNKKPN